MAEGLGLPGVDGTVERALDEAAVALEEADELVCACHVNPDGDALGSVLAVRLALGPRGVEVAPTWGTEELEIPGQYDFLPGVETLVRPDDVPDPDVALAIDCASADRLECVREKMTGARVLVNIDHHVSNTRFGTIDVVDAEAPSSSELVLRLFEKMGVEITPDVATCLYVGLFTDTGRFSYANATPRAHAAAAALIERGVAVDRVSQEVYESLPYGYLKLLGRVLERCRLLADPPLVVSYQTQADLAECGIGMDDTEEVVNVLRLARDVDATAILKELEDGNWKGSLRSKGETDVSSVAQSFGGGGHRLAAGFTSTFPLEETLKRIHEGLAEVMRAPR